MRIPLLIPNISKPKTKKIRISTLKSKCVRVALRAQLVVMMQNDLNFVLPDDNGRQICDLACKQLSYSAAKLTSRAAKAAASETDSTAVVANNNDGDDAGNNDSNWCLKLLKATTKIVDDVQKSLDACSRRENSEPHPLHLDSQLPTQFCDATAMSAITNTPDPGEEITRSRYVAVDFTQLPDRATTFQQASHALWMCDRLATLINNQQHCIKNSAMLIFSMIEHVFTRVVPLPKPRRKDHRRKGEAGLQTALAARKRRKKKEAERKAAEEERQRKHKAKHGAFKRPTKSPKRRAHGGDDLDNELEAFDAFVEGKHQSKNKEKKDGKGDEAKKSDKKNGGDGDGDDDDDDELAEYKQAGVENLHEAVGEPCELPILMWFSLVRCWISEHCRVLCRLLRLVGPGNGLCRPAEPDADTSGKTSASIVLLKNHTYTQPSDPKTFLLHFCWFFCAVAAYYGTIHHSHVRDAV